MNISKGTLVFTNFFGFENYFGIILSSSWMGHNSDGYKYQVLLSSGKTEILDRCYFLVGYEMEME